MHGQVAHHWCLSRHQENPALLPSRRRKKGAKRARGAGMYGTECAEEEEGEEGEEGEEEGMDMDED